MSDRHFDELATRFAEKIYGGAKGAIRLAVLQADLAEALPQHPLRVLDIGAGLGHMSLWLAQQGHAVTLAEPAEPMLEGARERFTSAGQSATFLQAPWQEVENHVEGRFDLVICHAVLEWLAEPQAILPVLHRLTAPDGWLSLAFYNRDALIYRNLLKGHFKKLRSQSFAGERQSLTPQRPLDPRELAAQLDPHWRGAGHAEADAGGVHVEPRCIATALSEPCRLPEQQPLHQRIGTDSAATSGRADSVAHLPGRASRFLRLPELELAQPAGSHGVDRRRRVAGNGRRRARSTRPAPGAGWRQGRRADQRQRQPGNATAPDLR